MEVRIGDILYETCPSTCSAICEYPSSINIFLEGESLRQTGVRTATEHLDARAILGIVHGNVKDRDVRDNVGFTSKLPTSKESDKRSGTFMGAECT